MKGKREIKTHFKSFLVFLGLFKIKTKGCLMLMRFLHGEIILSLHINGVVDEPKIKRFTSYSGSKSRVIILNTLYLSNCLA